MPNQDDTTPQWETIPPAYPGGEPVLVLTLGNRHIGAASRSGKEDGSWSIAANRVGLPICDVPNEADARRFLLKLGELMTGRRVPVELTGYTAREGIDAEQVAS